MANLPQSLSSINSPFGGPVSPAPSAIGTQGNKDRKMQSAEQLVLDLSNPDLRENALVELSKVYIYIYIYICICLSEFPRSHSPLESSEFLFILIFIYLFINSSTFLGLFIWRREDDKFYAGMLIWWFVSSYMVHAICGISELATYLFHFRVGKELNLFIPLF